MTGPVVVGVDGSERSLVAAEWAAREALRRGVGLLLTHACPPLPRRVSPVPGWTAWQHVGEQMLRRTADEFMGRHPGLDVEGVHTDTEPEQALLAAAADAGLLVVGARGWGGFDGLAVGSVALHVAATADCPVVTVPDPAARAPDADEVVVGFTGHAPADETIGFAFRAARERDALLRVVHAWALPPASPSAWMLTVLEEDRGLWEDQESQVVSDALRAWRERYPQVAVVPDVVLLGPAQALVRASERARLLVVGRRTSPRVAERRLGPVAHAVLHHAHCPVVVVPHPA
ncbi:universal stress protein [Streptomyces botrytidirepellens]|uniref:Universal stress protein n=1 Tax=Streptomyces botrytidirepellens TaxID=2486417 RepID=A0A3M8VPW0_9ACTN|nr:universal stress protein [Streptomyces botrytidirepellens]RNG17813.1 universal stress protein [Streptomyces botrytidirepellens]